MRDIEILRETCFDARGRRNTIKKHALSIGRPRNLGDDCGRKLEDDRNECVLFVENLVNEHRIDIAKEPFPHLFFGRDRRVALFANVHEDVLDAAHQIQRDPNGDPHTAW